MPSAFRLHLKPSLLLLIEGIPLLLPGMLRLHAAAKARVLAGDSRGDYPLCGKLHFPTARSPVEIHKCSGGPNKNLPRGVPGSSTAGAQTRGVHADKQLMRNMHAVVKTVTRWQTQLNPPPSVFLLLHVVLAPLLLLVSPLLSAFLLRPAVQLLMSPLLVIVLILLQLALLVLVLVFLVSVVDQPLTPMSKLLEYCYCRARLEEA